MHVGIVLCPGAHVFKTVNNLINNTGDNTQNAGDNRFKYAKNIKRKDGIKHIGKHCQHFMKNTLQCSKYTGCNNTFIAIHKGQLSAAGGAGNGCLHAVNFKQKRLSWPQPRRWETDSNSGALKIRDINAAGVPGVGIRGDYLGVGARSL